MKLRLLYISALFLFVQTAYPQVVLRSEEWKDSKYILSYVSNVSDVVYERNGRKFITLQATDDETGNESVPSRNLFVALPPNTNPVIRTIPTKMEHIVKDEIMDHDLLRSDFSSLKGFLWIGNNYCANITVNPVFYDKTAGNIVVVKEFIIEIELPNTSYNIKRSQVDPVNPAVENQLFGKQWQSSSPKYPVSQTDSWIDYSSDYIKFGVVRDGIYRISYNDLISFGVPVSSLNPKSIKMYLKGKEVPLYVRGEDDMSFGQGDFIEFVGRRNYGDTDYRTQAIFGSHYNEYLNIYSDTTIYWITWAGALGQRVDTAVSVGGVQADTLRYYDELLHIERNVSWDFSLNPNNLTAELRKNYPELLENETWYDGNLSVGKYSESFIVSDLYPGKPARAFVKLQNFSSSVDQNAHNLALSINNTATKYDSGFINKYQVKTLAANFSSSILQNGSNTVDIHSFTTANTVNVVARDWSELEYPRFLRAVNDSLSIAFSTISTPKPYLVVIAGITAGNISLYKYRTTDSAFIKITNYVLSADTLQFVDTVSNTTRYYVLRDDKIPSPIFFYKKRFTNLRSPSNKADYIAITHPYFQTAVSSYVSFISSTYNVTAKYVAVTDIYDEFNFGFFAPEPIKEFLIAANNRWQSPKPKYVTLIGKGTYDFYGNKTKYIGAPPITNFVPVWGNPVSDIWFVQWDTTGSLIPQMNIGRIPVNTIGEFQGYFLKHQKYVTKGFDDWNKRYLFFSGGNFTDPNQIAQAKGTNDFIINNYVSKKPVGGNAVNFYKTVNPITNFGPFSSEYIANQIDLGGVFISYIGHSGTQTWDNSITDIVQLANSRDRNPMISDFGCSTGKFAEPDVVSFSELAVSGLHGQAISYIGNSSLGFTSTAYSFPKTFYKKLLVDTSASLGDIHRLAKIDYIKQNSTDSYGLFIKTNTLIGDPIVQLPIPTKPNLTFPGIAIGLSPELPTEQTDTVIAIVKYFNLGSVENDSITISVKVEYNGFPYFYKYEKRIVPLYGDSVLVSFPVKGKPGEHTISVNIDSANSIIEIYENDNNYVHKILVASSSIRSLSPSATVNQSDGGIYFLNPSVSPLQSQFTVEVSLQSLFSQSQNYSMQYGTFFTKFTLDPSFQGKRIWVRTKYDNSNLVGPTSSFFYGDKENILFNDHISFQSVSKEKTEYINGALALDSTKVIFSAISAGWNDGKTAVISRDGQNYIPESTKRAHHVCLFDAATFEFKGYYLFDVLAGGAAVMNQYAQFLDTLSQEYIVIIAICDEGGLNLSTALKNAIKSIGSKYIDSVQYRYSWAIIGRKGASPGSVKEKFTRLFEGQVVLDTTFYTPNENGSFSTNPIGPVAVWKNIMLDYTEQIQGNITLNAIGIKADASQDTVRQWSVIDSVLDLSNVNADVYPSIKLAGGMKRNPGETSPTISTIEVNYDGLAELGTNYQTVKCYTRNSANQLIEFFSGDSVLQGEKIEIVFRVYNAGGVPVKNTAVKVLSVWENNTIEQLALVAVDSIGIRSYKEVTVQYNTSLGFGKRTVQIIVDPDTTVREMFKDNNIFAFPFVVKKNQTSPLLPNLAVSQAGIQPAFSPITNERDSVAFRIIYGNTGALVNDSITIAIIHFYQNVFSSEQMIRRKFPSSNDTFTVIIPVLKRSGEHSVRVDLDAVGLITELNETDNSASLFFTVLTTDFRIIQPTQYSISSVGQMIFLNPTSLDPLLPRISLLEIDTLQSFSSIFSLQAPMKEFTTEFPLASLQKSKRYFWRVKQLNSQRDWTTGSFYLGESTAFLLGQTDSLSWISNSFIRTGYDKTQGAKIVNTVFLLRAMSAGFNDGLTGSLEVNGVNILSPILGPGHNITVLDTTTFAVKAQRRFHIANDPSEVDSMVQFISSAANGDIVVNVVVDDGANNLTTAGRNIFKSIGSAFVDSLLFRDSWVIIGRKGAVIGSVPEQRTAQGTGPAATTTTISRQETSGSIVTQKYSSFSDLSMLTLNAVLPAGSQLTTKVIGFSTARIDTVVTVVNQTSIPLPSFSASLYSSFQLIFELKSNTSFNSPSIIGWNVTASQPIELATSAASASVSKNQIMEGEKIDFKSMIFNIASVNADSIPVRIKTIQNGLETVVKDEIVNSIMAHDSVVVNYTFDSRGKNGNLAFSMEIDPLNRKTEVTRENNSVTIPFVILGDTLRPVISILIDGLHVVNGDYIGQRPEVIVTYIDNNPSVLQPADTTNFKIRLNNVYVSFTPGTAELRNISQPGRGEIRWTPELEDGENIIQIFANDVTGNSSDTITMFVNVASQFKLMDVYNLPNPFDLETHFTFNLAGPVIPEEVKIRIYTVAGRLIQEIQAPATIGFNTVIWDGRDRDGDRIGNGVYFYRLIVRHQEKQITATSKMVKMR